MDRPQEGEERRGSLGWGWGCGEAWRWGSPLGELGPRLAPWWAGAHTHLDQVDEDAEVPNSHVPVEELLFVNLGQPDTQAVLNLSSSALLCLRSH